MLLVKLINKLIFLLNSWYFEFLVYCRAEAEQQKRTALMQQAANAKRAGKTVCII